MSQDKVTQLKQLGVAIDVEVEYGRDGEITRIEAIMPTGEMFYYRCEDEASVTRALRSIQQRLEEAQDGQ